MKWGEPLPFVSCGIKGESEKKTAKVGHIKLHAKTLLPNINGIILDDDSFVVVNVRWWWKGSRLVIMRGS